MTLLGNMLWFILAGWWSSLYYTACGVLCCITIIGIPIGKAMFQYAKLMAAPFGKVIVKETDLKGIENVSGIRRFGGTIANILWLPVGIITFLGNIGLMIACTISIVGIPAAIVLAKSCKFLLWPVGAKVVTKEEYENITLRRTVESSIEHSFGATSIPHASRNHRSNQFVVEDFFSKSAGIGYIVGWLALVLLLIFLFPIAVWYYKFFLVLSTLFHTALFVILSFLIAWLQSKLSPNASHPFFNLQFKSVKKFFFSIKTSLIEIFPTSQHFIYAVLGFVLIPCVISLIEPLMLSHTIHNLFAYFILDIPALIGFFIGAVIHRNSRPTVPEPKVVSRDSFDSGNYYAPQLSSRENLPPESPDVLTQSNTPLWMPGLPIIVTKANVVKRYSNFPEVSLQLEFQNLCDQPIIAVYFSARCYNLLKEELPPIEKQAVQDFTLDPGCFWTSSQAARCPANDTRRIELTIHNVVMADGSIWSNETGEILQPLPKQDKLGFSVDLFSEMHRLRNGIADFRNTFNGEQVLYSHLPVQTEHYWQCACGQVNLSGRCLRCNVLQGTVFDLTNAQRLADMAAERKAEEQRQKEERQQAIVEKQQAIKDTAGVISGKCISAAKVVAGKVSHGGKVLSGKLVQFWNTGKNFCVEKIPVLRQKISNNITSAKGKCVDFRDQKLNPLFERIKTLFKEKIYLHWKKILFITIFAILIVLVSTVSIDWYQTYRAEQARIQQEAAEEAARQEEARLQALAEAEERKRREEEEKRRLEEELRLEEERQKLESELPSIFQSVYDFCWQFSGDNHIDTEFAQLKTTLVGKNVTWSSEYEVQYMAWRTQMLKDLSEQLIIEYEKIIATRPVYKDRYEGNTLVPSGLYYADYHDFNNDQLPELVLLSATGYPASDNDTEINEHSILLEIYGNKSGEIIKYGEQKLYSAFKDTWLKLMQYQGRLFIGDYEDGGGNSSYITTRYYGFRDNQFGLVEETLIVSGYVDELASHGRTFYHNNKEITEEEYIAINEKYSTEVDLFRAGSGTNQGVLTKPTNRAIIINGQKLSTVGSLFAEEGYTLAPIRPILEAMGIPVYVDERSQYTLASTKKGTLTIWDTGIDLFSGEYTLRFNNEHTTISPRLIHGVMYAPIESLVALFGAQAQYSYEDRMLTISVNIPAEDLMTADEVERMATFDTSDMDAILAPYGYQTIITNNLIDGSSHYLNGKMYLEHYVLPIGVKYEVYGDENNWTDNAETATVSSDGEVFWSSFEDIFNQN